MSAHRCLLALLLLPLLIVFAACGEAEEELDVESPTVDASRTASPESTGDVTPGPDVPVDWETYTDAEYGFSVRYPPDLQLDEQTVALTAVDGIPATDLKIVSFERADGAPVVGVSVTPNPAGVSLEEWIRKQPGWPCEPDASPTCEVTHPIVDGERGIRFSIDVLGQPAATVYVAHGNNIYVLHGNVSGSAEYPPTLTEGEFGQVLDGFKFTK